MPFYQFSIKQVENYLKQLYKLYRGFGSLCNKNHRNMQLDFLKYNVCLNFCK